MPDLTLEERKSRLLLACQKLMILIEEGSIYSTRHFNAVFRALNDVVTGDEAAMQLWTVDEHGLITFLSSAGSGSAPAKEHNSL